MAMQDQTPARPRVIVVGNEKGGSGKSTTSMHLIGALLHAGQRVGSIDLDARQATLSRYLENRRSFMARTGVNLVMPMHRGILPSEEPDRALASARDTAAVAAALADLGADADYIVIDTPGSASPLSQAGHSYADILITPMNDSFVDLDVLASVDPEAYKILRPSQYAEMVWEQRKQRAQRDGGSIDWVVMRNRMGQLDSHNRQAVEQALTRLAKRFGFRVASAFSERVIFRELFLEGLTLLDLQDPETGVRLSMSHVAARQEVRALLETLGLPAAL
jgi:chromosome partitioning protein